MSFKYIAVASKLHDRQSLSRALAGNGNDRAAGAQLTVAVDSLLGVEL